MAKGFLQFKVGPDKDTKRVLSMVREYPKRIKAVRGEFTREVAEEVKNDLVRAIPKTSTFKDYREGLRVSKVGRFPGVDDVFTVDVPSNKKSAKNVDPKVTIFLISPKPRARGSLGKIKVLQQYGPWTSDTLPFYPAESEAVIITRRVTRKEAASIRNKRNRDAPKWKAALASAGAVERKSGRKTLTSKQGTMVPDVAFQALRMEFGIGGQTSKAHWRPTILNIARRKLPKLFKKRTKYDKVMSEPQNVDWLTWPKREKSQLSAREVNNFKEFQDRLGLRMRV